MREDDILAPLLDPDIVEVTETGEKRTKYENLEPLMVATVNTGPLRPDSATRISKLFLAANYVQTSTQLPCMETANEAARRAVNGIIADSRVGAPLCRIWSLHEPRILGLWRSYDAYRYARGLPWKRPPSVYHITGWLLLLGYHLFVRARGRMTGYRAPNSVSPAARPIRR